MAVALSVHWHSAQAGSGIPPPAGSRLLLAEFQLEVVPVIVRDIIMPVNVEHATATALPAVVVRHNLNIQIDPKVELELVRHVVHMHNSSALTSLNALQRT